MAIAIKIFKQEAKFIAGAAKISQLPRIHQPQIAFIGKSNVGKSSLINKLCNRRALARTSHTPGRTQQINFFSIEERLILVDLPGYGFAKVSGNQRANWNRLIPHYLSTTPELKLVNLLIDARRGIKAHDQEIIAFLQENHLNFQLIFTKADQIKNQQEFIATIRETSGLENNMILTSSKKNIGVKELQYSIIASL